MFKWSNKVTFPARCLAFISNDDTLFINREADAANKNSDTPKTLI